MTFLSWNKANLLQPISQTTFLSWKKANLLQPISQMTFLSWKKANLLQPISQMTFLPWSKVNLLQNAGINSELTCMLSVTIQRSEVRQFMTAEPLHAAVHSVQCLFYFCSQTFVGHSLQSFLLVTASNIFCLFSPHCQRQEIFSQQNHRVHH